MRIQPWIKTAVGAVILMAVGTFSVVHAQGPGFQAPYSTNQPQNIYPPGLLPQNAAPWPMVSPYQSANIGSDTTYQGNDGLWYRRILTRRTDWIFSLEAVAMRYRDAGDATVGAPYAALRADTDQPPGFPADPSVGEFPTVSNFTPNVEGFFLADPRVFPIPFLDAGNAEFDDNAIRFRPSSGAALGDPNAAGGIKGTTGFFAEDGTGVMFSGFWADTAGEINQRGTDNFFGVPITQAITTQYGAQNLAAYGAVPLNNGESPRIEFGPGSTAKYDILYRTEFFTQAAGANVSFYLPSVIDNDAVQIRPLWGARYLYINESFGFRGIDSGFTYDLADDTFRPTGGAISYDQFEANLRNEIRTQLGGPEVGFRIDLATNRDAFHMYTETTLAVAANYEKASMSGQNIGDPLVDIQINGLTTPRMLEPGVDTRFTDKQDRTHVSPVFTQSVFADFDLFSLPPFTRFDLLENTRFKVGYTLIYAGKVARPLDSINWQGFPLTPEISLSHENWWAHQWSAGIDWTF
ncbi:MAG: hypothetical protein R3C18_03450 [Planctomycetaceae bacterium]